jgi:hypothetical protein
MSCTFASAAGKSSSGVLTDLKRHESFYIFAKLREIHKAFCHAKVELKPIKCIIAKNGKFSRLNVVNTFSGKQN